MSYTPMNNDLGQQAEMPDNDNEVNRKKEKYIRDAGKIEDFPSTEGADSSGAGKKVVHTDKNGEEKDEDYINTDERQRDIRHKTNRS